MPKVQISTYQSFDILADGTIVRVPVTNIVSEDANVQNYTKKVSVFDKYFTKKGMPRLSTKGKDTHNGGKLEEADLTK